ncbi:hypothetical protein B0J17DRAFT_715911 [Rhizoctonia solani]|nr:hypothetical protein B0J17DRAFT_715911 [Rhizoctonia solani]
MCRQIVERYRFEACGHTRLKDGPIVGVKDCLKSTCSKSRKHPQNCNANACRQKYDRAIYPERPEPGYCSEKCEGRSSSYCVIA